ncbi:hypothetical protein AAFC00_001976 [Neodothiora populina]|uniref:Uncharacterized protein n=1 Tax=Neodothiora populina TaxID=2781224 RepID=A0ABR3PQY8_9PEZI
MLEPPPLPPLPYAAAAAAAAGTLSSASVAPSQSASQMMDYASASASQVSGASTSHRTGSPVRRAAALRNAQKPVLFPRLTAHNRPANVADLLDQLKDVETGMGFVPKAIEARLARLVDDEGKKLRPCNTDNSPTSAAEDANAIQDLALLEFLYTNATFLQERLCRRGGVQRSDTLSAPLFGSAALQSTRDAIQCYSGSHLPGLGPSAWRHARSLTIKNG